MHLREMLLHANEAERQPRPPSSSSSSSCEGNGLFSSGRGSPSAISFHQSSLLSTSTTGGCGRTNGTRRKTRSVASTRLLVNPRRRQEAKLSRHPFLGVIEKRSSFFQIHFWSRRRCPFPSNFRALLAVASEMMAARPERMTEKERKKRENGEGSFRADAPTYFFFLSLPRVGSPPLI